MSKKKLPNEMKLEEKLLYGMKIIKTNKKLKPMISFLEQLGYTDGDFYSMVWEALYKTEKKMYEIYTWYRLYYLMLLNVIGDTFREELRYSKNTVLISELEEQNNGEFIIEDTSSGICFCEDKNIVEKNTLFGIEFV